MSSLGVSPFLGLPGGSGNYSAVDPRYVRALEHLLRTARVRERLSLKVSKCDILTSPSHGH